MLILANPNQNPIPISIPGGGGGSGAGAVITWKASDTWASVVAQLPAPASGTGAIVLLIDDGTTNDWTMDSPADLTNVKLIGMSSAVYNNFGICKVVVTAGAGITGGQLNADNIIFLGFGGQLFSGAATVSVRGTQLGFDNTFGANPALIDVAANGSCCILIDGANGFLQGFDATHTAVKLGANVSAYIDQGVQSLLSDFAVEGPGTVAMTVNYSVDGVFASANAFVGGITPSFLPIGQPPLADQNQAIAIGVATVTTGAAFADIGDGVTTGFASWVVTPPAEQRYTLVFTLQGIYAVGAPAAIEFQFVIDGVTIPGQPTFQVPLSPISVYVSATGTFNTPKLDRTPHTIKVQWRHAAGQGAIDAAFSTLMLQLFR